MNRGGYRRARLMPGNAAIAWKSTAGKEEAASLPSVGDLRKTSLKAAKAAAPVAKGVAMSTPQGQTGKASAVLLSRILKDRQARSHAVRVAREDEQARNAVKVIRAEHKKTGADGKGTTKPVNAGSPKRDGKGDNLMTPDFAKTGLPPLHTGSGRGPRGRMRILHYWEKGGF